MQGELTQEQVSIHGPRGALAGELAYANDAAASALVINPHPHMGGEMENNLVAALALGLPEHAVATLRFDYRGVGRSEGARVDTAASMAQFWATGQAPEDPQMIAEARAASMWLSRQVKLPQVVIGYSFGAYAASRLMDLEPAAVVLIAPTLTHHDFSVLRQVVMPCLVVHSDNDFATPLPELQRWLGTLPECVRVVCVAGAEHFFRDRENKVVEQCGQFIGGVMSKEARQ